MVLRYPSIAYCLLPVAFVLESSSRGTQEVTRQQAAHLLPRGSTQTTLDASQCLPPANGQSAAFGAQTTSEHKKTGSLAGGRDTGL